MLEWLHLKHVGPAPEMALELAPRLNLITGDNGLGKSFLLDVAWWAMTRTWAGFPVRPSLATLDAHKTASIAFRYEGESRTRAFESRFVPQDQEWTSSRGRPANPGLVIYARVDGGFAVWDPVRNSKARESAPAGGLVAPALPRYYGFDPAQVWNGIQGAGSQVLSNGLVRDWVSWQLANDWKFEALRDALKAMSEAGDPLQPGSQSTRISLDDVRDYPTLHMANGEDVAIVLASAAIRRIAALAYLLVWTWSEHLATSRQLGLEPTPRIVFLVDEVESHLHPRWQRTIVPSLMSVVEVLAPTAQVQLILSTHSPLVLASVETAFDPNKDAWFDLDLERSLTPPVVELRKRTFLRRGEVGNWLTSEAFDLAEPRSLEAEQAILAALELARQASPDRADIQRVEDLLRASLGDIDRFWVRWTAFRTSLAGGGGAKP